jgi:hypothetical protein
MAPNRRRLNEGSAPALEHVRKKWEPVLRRGHAQTKK